MTDKEKALEGIDTFFTKITEAGEVIANKLVAVSPDVAEALLNLIRYKAAFDIFTWVLLTLIFTGITIYSKKLLRKTMDYEEKVGSD